MLRSAKNPNLRISWMPQKRTKNGLKIYWISKKLLWLYLNTLKLKNFVHFKTFYKILTKFLLWFLNHFDSLLGKKWTHLPLVRIIFNWGMSKKNFSSKFQLWTKMIAAPPGSWTRIKKISRKTSSGMFKGTKSMFLFFGHFF